MGYWDELLFNPALFNTVTPAAATPGGWAPTIEPIAPSPATNPWRTELEPAALAPPLAPEPKREASNSWPTLDSEPVLSPRAPFSPAPQAEYSPFKAFAADVKEPTRKFAPPSQFDAANAALKLNPQEQDFYKRHLTNLYGPGGVTNPDGSRSTLLQTTVEADGRYYTIPTVWGGKIYDMNDDAQRARIFRNVGAVGWDKFPSYSSLQEAEDRYGKLHSYFDQDARDWAAREKAPKPYRGTLGESFGMMSPADQQAWLDQQYKDYENGQKRIANLEALIKASPSPYATRAYQSQLNTTRATLPDLNALNEMKAGRAPLPTKTGLRAGTENVVQGFSGAVLGIPEFAGIVAGYLGDEKVDDNALLKWAQDTKLEVNRMFPGDVARQNDFSMQLAQGVGQLGAFYGGGAVTALLKAGPKAAAAVVAAMGGSATGSQGFEEATREIKAAQDKARAAGDTAQVDELDRILKTFGYAGLGLTEAIPIAKTLTRSVPGGGLFGRAAAAAEGALEEGLQEGGSQLGQNIITQQTTDPSRATTEGVAESAALGAILGGGAGAVLGGGKAEPRIPEITPEVEAPYSGQPYSGAPGEPLSFIDLVPGEGYTVVEPTRELGAPLKALEGPRATEEVPGAVGAPEGPSAAPEASPEADAALQPRRTRFDYGRYTEPQLTEMLGYFEERLANAKADPTAPQQGKLWQDYYASKVKGAKEALARFKQSPEELKKAAQWQPSKLTKFGNLVVREQVDPRRPKGGSEDSRYFVVHGNPGNLELSAVKQPAKQLGPAMGSIELEKAPDGRWNVALIEVNPKYQNSGAAMALMRAAQNAIGERLEPSGILLPDGYAMLSRSHPAVAKWWQPWNGMYLSPKQILRTRNSYQRQLNELNAGVDLARAGKANKATYTARAVIDRGPEYVAQEQERLGTLADLYNRGLQRLPPEALEVENLQQMLAKSPKKEAKKELPEKPFKASGKPTEPGNPLTRPVELSAELDADQITDTAKKLLNAGRAVLMPQAIVDAHLEAFAALGDALPNSIPGNVLTRVEPAGFDEAGKPLIHAFFQTTNGEEVAMEGVWEDLTDVRAFYMPPGFGNPSGLFLLPVDPAQSGSDRLRGVLRHELLHALRREGHLPLSAWNRLLGHATDLNILGLGYADFARKTRDPYAENYESAPTIRELYAEYNKDRPDYDEAMDQEAVAHMLELYSHGGLTEQQIAPIRDILDAIDNGAFSEPISAPGRGAAPDAALLGKWGSKSSAEPEPQPKKTGTPGSVFAAMDAIKKYSGPDAINAIDQAKGLLKEVHAAFKKQYPQVGWSGLADTPEFKQAFYEKIFQYTKGMQGATNAPEVNKLLMAIAQGVDLLGGTPLHQIEGGTPIEPAPKSAAEEAAQQKLIDAVTKMVSAKAPAAAPGQNGFASLTQAEAAAKSQGPLIAKAFEDAVNSIKTPYAIEHIKMDGVATQLGVAAINATEPAVKESLIKLMNGLFEGANTLKKQANENTAVQQKQVNEAIAKNALTGEELAPSSPKTHKSLTEALNKSQLNSSLKKIIRDSIQFVYNEVFKDQGPYTDVVKTQAFKQAVIDNLLHNAAANEKEGYAATARAMRDFAGTIDTAPDTTAAPAVSVPAGLSFDDLIPAPDRNYTFVGNAGGGSKPKEIWQDEEGNEYMFKPNLPDRPFSAHGEAAGGHISRLINPNAPRIWVQSLNGRLGVMQEMLPNSGTLRGTKMSELTPQEITALMREHVVDWLISNHDGHSNQFLITDKGLVGIDKGQAFKYIGKDRLDTDYHPNEVYGEEEPIYNKLWRALTQGKLDGVVKKITAQGGAQLTEDEAEFKRVQEELESVTENLNAQREAKNEVEQATRNRITDLTDRDHPSIKEVRSALKEVFDKYEQRFLGDIKEALTLKPNDWWTRVSGKGERSFLISKDPEQTMLWANRSFPPDLQRTTFTPQNGISAEEAQEKFGFYPSTDSYLAQTGGPAGEANAAFLRTQGYDHVTFPDGKIVALIAPQTLENWRDYGYNKEKNELAASTYEAVNGFMADVLRRAGEQLGNEEGRAITAEQADLLENADPNKVKAEDLQIPALKAEYETPVYNAMRSAESAVRYALTARYDDALNAGRLPEIRPDNSLWDFILDHVRSKPRSEFPAFFQQVRNLYPEAGMLSAKEISELERKKSQLNVRFYGLKQAVEEGRAEVDNKLFEPAYEAINTLQNGLTDEAYLGMIRPYAEARFKGRPKNRDAFLDYALQRKHNLANKFHRFFQKLSSSQERRKKALQSVYDFDENYRNDAAERHGLSAEEFAAIYAYTGDHSDDINRELRQDKKAGRSDPLALGTERLRWLSYAELLESALEKLPPFTGEVYRGQDLDAEELAKWKPGRIIVTPAFWSTSYDKTNSFSGKVKLHIQSLTGRNIEELSSHQSEKEVLFPTERHFLITHIDDSGADTYGDPRTDIWLQELEEINFEKL